MLLYYVTLTAHSVWCGVKESLKPGIIKQAAEKLKQVEAFLGANQWFAGDRVSLLMSHVTVYWCVDDGIGIQRL